VVPLLCSQPNQTETPRRASAPVEQPAADSREVSAAKPGVLVVDDEPLLLAVLDAGLHQRGFAVWLASNGLQALEVYQAHRKEISIVLLDVRMPGLDGPRTLTALQRLNPAIRCCFMTGNMGLYTPEELTALGAVEVFAKPFDLTRLAEALWQLASPGPMDSARASGS
jgi:CheY-like chemotaxis protein